MTFKIKRNAIMRIITEIMAIYLLNARATPRAIGKPLFREAFV